MGINGQRGATLALPRHGAGKETGSSPPAPCRGLCSAAQQLTATGRGSSLREANRAGGSQKGLMRTPYSPQGYTGPPWERQAGGRAGEVQTFLAI